MQRWEEEKKGLAWQGENVWKQEEEAHLKLHFRQLIHIIQRNHARETPRVLSPPVLEEPLGHWDGSLSVAREVYVECVCIYKATISDGLRAARGSGVASERTHDGKEGRTSAAVTEA